MMTRAKTLALLLPELPPTLGQDLCRWIEQYLVHGEGDFLGQPFLLEPWQKRIIYRLYEYDPKTLRRIVRRALIILPKGCGKTELTAAIGLAELCGPVTIGSDGRPTRRTAPNIPVAAASYEQANKLYGAAKLIAENGPLSQFLDIYDTQMQLKDDVGTMFRVAAEAGTNDGGLPTAFLADEIHEWVGRKARVHLVIGNSLAKRAGALEINLSTPDDADPESLLGKLVAYGDRILAGEIVDPSFLYVRYSAPMEISLDEPVALREGLRECHPASWIDIERVAARWEVDKIPEHEFRRYHLAQFVRSSTAWLREGAWAACADSTRSPDTIPSGTEIVLGFDGCVDEKTEILTARGWSRFPDLTPLDRVATLNSEHEVEWHCPTRKVIRWHDGPMIHFSGHSIDMLVTPDHDLLVTRPEAADWQRVPASSVRDKWGPQGGRPRWRVKKNARSQVAERCEFVDIPAHPDPARGRPIKHVGRAPIREMLRLMGYYAAEGSVCRGSNYKGEQGTPRGRVVLSQKTNVKVTDDMAGCVSAVGLLPRVTPTGVRVQSRELAEYLADQIGTSSASKRIPRWVMRLDADLLSEFFEAYMAGDGHTSPEGHRSATTKSRQLADDLQEMALRLGLSASVRYVDGYDWWYVSFIQRNEPCLHRKPIEVNHTGWVFDVTVPNHVIYVRRNGKAYWTGNSYNDDSTALVGCTVEEQPHVFVVGLWEKPERARGDWVVPRDEVAVRIAEAIERYRVLELAADPPGWHSEIAQWEERYGHVVVTEFRTNMRKFMARACARLHSAVANGTMTHDGNNRLSGHVANAITKETTDGAYITKEYRHSARKIDAATAAVIAFDRAVTLHEKGKSVYEGRGMVTV